MSNRSGPGAAALRVEAVTRALPMAGGEVPILHGVDFEVARGEWVALMGPSGSGKSTLLGIVAGLDTPSSGRVWIDGVEVTHMKESALAGVRNRKVGIVFQSFNLIPALTAQENVEAPLYVGPNRRRARELAERALERVGLADRRRHRPQQLSGGQQQRVAIARALVTEPALLVADEPTGNLDTRTGAQILDLFAELRAELDLTLLVVTHDTAVAERAGRILHLVDGRLDPAGAWSAAGAVGGAR